MNYMKCAQYLSQLGITLSRNESGPQQKWSTTTPAGNIIQFSSLRHARNYWDLAAKQCAYQLARSRTLVLAAESLDEKSRSEFNDWIDGIQHSLPDEMFEKNINTRLEHSTESWEFEARKLAKTHGSIADATFTVLLKQARQERLDAFSPPNEGLQNGKLGQQYGRREGLQSR
ncbi:MULTISPECIES: hypothetical protein [Xanthomonas]|uniref:Uncharacterized protein n=1 Tax=Xanthomonas campestris pv. phaseoli TaxID=317013 RepID=A0A7Z7J0X4_XANCH|nr:MULTISPECIES: hypothetical protein [Xanthomonas]QTD88006.1 hypothetical protein XcfCFBP6988P_23520 [Xanthomonas citri pv. phaseoli var. fuscans]QTF14087.1 hypothetical protein XcfCFBP6989P_23435 [Xanthomonas citri pv. phaseoli var. fuscans]QTF14312.1 hypothetical protein XcfCFBP6991P_24175 [Xanthomonas citri pv. phaseoli var. fuscans]QTF76287.1 hypothetical protein XcfCFBP6990P_23465 [Xanthomonas citri pv. phaseoli var. fuscans]UZB01152.1 hypothetical protein OM946_08120 [Xanthomonas citri 